MQPVDVTIAGRSYTIRSGLPEAKIRQVAGFVEQQLAMTAAAVPSADSYRVAVLTLLNVAGEHLQSGACRTGEEPLMSGPINELIERIDGVLVEGQQK